MTGCPHADILFCPLYHEAHVGDGFGCDDGRLDEGGCAADRGLDYGRAVARLAAAKPRVVAEHAFLEEAERLKAQRARNRRLNGVH